MFGYLRPMKSELKIVEYQAYNAVYCGFCRALGNLGALLRLTLSYDFTFFSLLSLSLNSEFCGFEKCRCPVKPFSKRPCVKQSTELSYAADLAVLMLYAKLCDNISDKDSFSLMSRFAMLYIKPKYKKISKKLPFEAKALEQYLINQQKAESLSQGVDACCDPTALLLSSFFERLSQNEEQRKRLSRLGYVLGRWIYLLDAVDDLESDIKSGSFNPLKPNDKNTELSEIKNNCELWLNVCISEACDEFIKLELYNFDSILKNIIFLGLKNTQNAVLHSKSKKERRRALNGKSI